MEDDLPDATPTGDDLRGGQDLCAYIDASPSPFHAVTQLAQRLQDDGFTALEERQQWSLEAGQTGYVIRDGGSIAAFRMGSEPPSKSGFRLIGAHTDSPTYRVRPRPVVSKSGYGQVAVEVYGGPLHYTWLDRDLTLAGRIVGRSGRTTLVHASTPLLRIPSLAIHMNRDINDKGFQVNPQNHLVPMFAAAADEVELADLLPPGHDHDDIMGWDLVLADTQPATLGGLHQQFVFAPRQDNLVSCHAAAQALLDAPQAASTQVVVCNDHEEVGSKSAEGAAGPFLEDTLRRLVAATGDHDPQAVPRAIAGSMLVSCDSAHALHPNYADKHDDGHRPRLGGGPVIKTHANQAYATDAKTLAWFATCCVAADVPFQHFTNRADSPSGSTIGPLTATRLGLPTVDIGNSLLSMHSIREQSATKDLAHLTRALCQHLIT